MREGRLFIVSGPSGAGKDSILRLLLEQTPNVRISVSYTTRAPRDGETDGVDYRFVSRETFEQMIGQDTLLEYTEYCGTYYGTPRQPVEQMLRAGVSVILKIEREGMQNVLKKRPDAITVFIAPPDMETLRQRIVGRKSEDSDALRRRLDRAVEEIRLSGDYRYRIVNNDLQTAVDELAALIRRCTAQSD